MSKRLAAAKAALKDENRGSTIIVVIVAVAFVAVLGSLLLFMSMINIQMKSMDRQGRDTFYDAETALNEVRLHLQEASSWAIKEAYPVFLAQDYADKVAEDDQDGQDAAVKAFNQRFVEKLLEYKVDVGGSDTKLLTGSGHTVTGYNVDFLQSFFDPDHVTITGSGDVDGTADTADALILKDVKLELEQNGYRSTIVTDLCLNKPLFYDSRSDELLNYVVVAKGSVIKPEGGSDTEIKGNVYAKEVTIKSQDQTLTVDDQERRVVCAGKLENFGKFTISRSDFHSSELWAERVVVGNNAQVNLRGSSFIADDLDLAGVGSKAVVAGEYYGFGNALNDGKESSGIVINGKDTSLDMSKVTRLMLAGHTYIKPADGMGLAVDNVTNDEVMMGESISVKSNQLAYMIPSPAVTGTATIPGNSNPLLVTNTQLRSLPDYAVGGSSENNKQAIKKALVAPAYRDRTRLMFINIGTGETKLIYFFNSNDSVSQRRAEANRQFKNYFERNSHVMPAYFSRFTDKIALPADAVMEMSGHAVEYGGGTVTRRPALTAASPLASASHQYERTFSRLCHTLSPTVHCSGRHGVDTDVKVTPYDHYVKDEAVKKLGDNEPKTLEFGNSLLPLVLVVNNTDEYIVSSTNIADLSSVRLIIASGNVKVESDFTGLIIAGGEVKVTAGTLTAMNDDDGDKEKIKAMPEVSEYLNLMTKEDDSPWDMENLVTYQNWSKE